ncbi:MAG: S9 family peptidase [Thermoanaerobaculia bacterium]
MPTIRAIVVTLIVPIQEKEIFMRSSLTSLTVLGLATGLIGCGGPPGDGGDAAPVTLTQAEVELIPRDALLGNPERFRGRISPDGSTVSFLAPVDEVQNVWVAPLGDSAAARVITHDTKRGIGVYFWAADGEHILYLQDQGGNENWQVHAVNVSTAEDRTLTPLEGVQAQILATSYSHPSDILVGLNDRDAQWHDVYRLNIETGERELVEQNETEMAGYVADTELELRLALKNTPDGGSEAYRRGANGDWESFFTIPPDDTLTTAIIEVADNGTTAHGVDSRDRDTAALVSVDIPTGEVTILAEDDRADVEQILTHPVTGEVLAYAVNYTEMEWIAVAEEVEADIAAITAELGGYVLVLGQTQANDKWILYSDEPSAPGHYYAYDRSDKSLSLLFNTRPALDGFKLATATAHVIPARDGVNLVSYLTLPAWVDADGDGIPSESVPMVLLVHGGPWARDTFSFSGITQLLANRGYAVLQVNFRGSTGFGKSFVNAGDLEWGEAMHDDLIDAVDWAIAKGVTREDTVAIMGGSYGGYATLAGMTFTPERFAAGVDIVGPSNLETLLNSIPPYWASILEIFARRVGDPRTEEGKALLAERSPLFKADQIVRPLLVGQGANDPRVKQAEADQIVAAMKTKNLPVTYVIYPDEGHGFQRQPNNLSFFAITDVFLASHLGGRFQPIEAADLEDSSIQVPEGAELIPGLAEALTANEAAEETEEEVAP